MIQVMPLVTDMTVEQRLAWCRLCCARTWNNHLGKEDLRQAPQTTPAAGLHKSITNVMNNVTTAHPRNDADDNKSSGVQEEEEEVKEKSADVDNNNKLTSNNIIMLCYLPVSHSR